MRLIQVEIEGYRSIGEKITVHVERDVTVLLGPNDHGKTNILHAIAHLNRDTPFSSDSDLNWDRDKHPDKFPAITFRLHLNAAEHLEFSDRWVKLAAAAASSDTPSASRPTTVPDEVPRILTVEITGVGANRVYKVGDDGTSIFTHLLQEGLPRVEIIRSQAEIPDSISVAELTSESHEFMRGILYYAGINPAEPDGLFTQTDTTMRRLQKASEVLNATLKADWVQGSDLIYSLAHDSASERIVLRIEDPAVHSRLCQGLATQ